MSIADVIGYALIVASQFITALLALADGVFIDGLGVSKISGSDISLAKKNSGWVGGNEFFF